MILVAAVIPMGAAVAQGGPSGGLGVAPAPGSTGLAVVVHHHVHHLHHRIGVAAHQRHERLGTDLELRRLVLGVHPGGAVPGDRPGYPFTIPAGSPAPAAATFFSDETGTGSQTLTCPFQLTVPANATPGTYTSTWTITVQSGP